MSSIQNKFRRLLRPLLDANMLEARQIYYDYGSYIPPIETPNSEWVCGSKALRKKDFLKGGPTINQLSKDVYTLTWRYMTMEVKVKGSVS